MAKLISIFGRTKGYNNNHLKKCTGSSNINEIILHIIRIYVFGTDVKGCILLHNEIYYNIRHKTRHNYEAFVWLLSN